MGKGKFIVHYDSEGNSTRIISNGGQALKVKVDYVEFTYRITDVKTGLTLVNNKSPSWRALLVNVKKDIIAIFEMHPLGSSNIYTNPINNKTRRLA